MGANNESATGEAGPQPRSEEYIAARDAAIRSGAIVKASCVDASQRKESDLGCREGIAANVLTRFREGADWAESHRPSKSYECTLDDPVADFGCCEHFRKYLGDVYPEVGVEHAGGQRQVPPAKWGCAPHWFKLPRDLHDRIWRTFDPGQEVNGTPSTAYLAAARAAQDWIKANTSPSPQMQLGDETRRHAHPGAKNGVATLVDGRQLDSASEELAPRV